MEKFFYQKILFLGYKLNVLIKNCLVIIGIFTENLSPYYIRMYMLHMFVAFLNFNGDYFETMKNNIVKKISKLIFEMKILIL